MKPSAAELAVKAHMKSITMFIFLLLVGCEIAYYKVADEQYLKIPEEYKSGHHDKVLLYTPASYYPQNLCDAGYEGYVDVELDIDENGVSENLRIIDSDSEEKFGGLALDQVSQYRFLPRVIDGNPVKLEGVQYRIKFCSKVCRPNSGASCAHRSIYCE